MSAAVRHVLRAENSEFIIVTISWQNWDKSSVYKSPRIIELYRLEKTPFLCRAEDALGVYDLFKSSN